MISDYQFNAEKHEHYIKGIRVPGVTTILKAEGFINYEFASPQAMYRGTYVHRACQLIAKNDLDIESIKPEFKGYIEAFMDFIKLNGFGKEKSEVNVYSRTWMYAGILDLIISDECLFDIKTSKVAASWWKYQTAGYMIAYNEMAGKKVIKTRHSLQLFDNGTYKIEQHKDKSDERNFLSILTVNKLKIRDGITKGPGDEQ